MIHTNTYRLSWLIRHKGNRFPAILQTKKRKIIVMNSFPHLRAFTIFAKKYHFRIEIKCP